MRMMEAQLNNLWHKYDNTKLSTCQWNSTKAQTNEQLEKGKQYSLFMSVSVQKSSIHGQ